MKKIIYLGFTAFTLGTLLLAGCSKTPSEPGKYAELAKCLTEKGVTFYGAYWCPHCADQKKLFGDDIQFVKYVECDPNGANADPAACQKAGVEKFPTWAFPGQENITGVQNPEALAKKANCPYEVEEPVTSTEKDETTTTATNAGTDEDTPGSTENTGEEISDSKVKNSEPAKEVGTQSSQTAVAGENTIKVDITADKKATVEMKFVTITGSGFSPSSISLKVGDKIIFKNSDSKPHWPASDPHPAHTNCPGFDAKIGLKTGESYSYTFEKAETCSFHDHLNPSWKGTVTVKE